MDLSVIVCTYNRCRLLAGNLEALARQVTPPELSWEVLIVDNNCTDDTANVVDTAQKESSVPIRRVVETKQGLSNARNCGIAAARGRYLAFTDDDTRPLPHWVEAIWQTFEQEHCDAVAGRVELVWPLARPRWLVDDLLSSLAHADYGPAMRPLSVTQEPPLGANMAFTRAVFQRVGNFDPALGRIGKKLLGGEETDLYERVLDAGFKVLYQPSAVMRHAVEPERVRKTYFRKLYYYGGQVHGQQISGAARQLFGVPVFGIRQLVLSGWRFFIDALRDELDLAFKQELNIWWHWGFLTGRYKAHRLQRESFSP
jgi:glycosyltransferase involved in cell wall biosynthesis